LLIRDKTGTTTLLKVQGTGTLAWGGGAAITSSGNVPLLNATNTFTGGTQIFQAASAALTYAAAVRSTSGIYGRWGVFSNDVYFTSNAAYNSSWSQDDATKASWQLYLGCGGDAIQFSRMPAGGAAFTGLLTLSSTGLLTIAGGQIQFPATQSPSANVNTLDDYKEGSWTPTGNGITFTTAQGRYQKVGNTVNWWCKVVFPATADAGRTQISGLPYSINAAVDNYSATLGQTDSGRNDLWQVSAVASRLEALTNLNATVSNSLYSTKTVSLSGSYEIA
jgi:hypothetical protein